jgi:hypothetical protein
MATGDIKCDQVVLGNVAAVFVVKKLPPARPQALQSGGSHPTSTCSKLTKRQSI